MSKNEKILSDAKIDNDWKAYFKDMTNIYNLQFIVYLVVTLISLGFTIFSIFKPDSFLVFTIGFVVISVYSLTNTIANKVRYNDMVRLFTSPTVESRIIKITSLAKNDINKIYCYIYPKACNADLKVGYKYKIEFLPNTWGKYVVGWEDLGEVSDKEFIGLTKEDKAKLEENNIHIKANLTKEDIDAELKETERNLLASGIDINEIRAEISDKDRLQYEIDYEVNRILLRDQLKKDAENKEQDGE